MIRMPLYRAKSTFKGDFKEGYYIYSEYQDKHIITQDLGKSTNHEVTGGYSLNHWFEVDPSTLAIHFPDMLDSQGNKIFASLSEDGKGGDIVSGERYEDNYEYAKKNGKIEYFTEVVKFERAETNISDICDTGAYSYSTNHTNLKIVGIQQ